MADDDFHAVSEAQALGQLFRQEDGAMLAARAAEGNHQVFEAALLVIVDGGVHQGKHAREELVHALLLVKVIDDRGVFAGKGLEAFFAAGIGQAAAIKDESSAISRFILRQAAMKGKTVNAHDQILRFGGQAEKLLRGQHTLKRFHQSRQFDGQFCVVEEPAKVFQGVGDALKEMSFAFVEAAKTVGAERLENAHVDVGVVIVEEDVAVQVEKLAQAAEIMFEEILAERRWQIGFGVE